MAWDGKFDDSEAEMGKRPNPGTHKVEIFDAEVRESSKGDGMLSLKLGIDGYDWTVYDNIMLSGKGAGIGKAKAKGFGVILEKGMTVQAEDFVNRRAFAHLVADTYDGKLRLKVDIEQGDHCGYDKLSFDEDGEIGF